MCVWWTVWQSTAKTSWIHKQWGKKTINKHGYFESDFLIHWVAVCQLMLKGTPSGCLDGQLSGIVDVLMASPQGSLTTSGILWMKVYIISYILKQTYVYSWSESMSPPTLQMTPSHSHLLLLLNLSTLQPDPPNAVSFLVSFSLQPSCGDLNLLPRLNRGDSSLNHGLLVVLPPFLYTLITRLQ